MSDKLAVKGDEKAILVLLADLDYASKESSIHTWRLVDGKPGYVEIWLDPAFEGAKFAPAARRPARRHGREE